MVCLCSSSRPHTSASDDATVITRSSDGSSSRRSEHSGDPLSHTLMKEENECLSPETREGERGEEREDRVVHVDAIFGDSRRQSLHVSFAGNRN